ncbi:membrane protein insertase YidC [Bogoriella caseilytica]|uniref:Membrane protein insertase YidC n=1 Tax=Bogoriella caseilytica TaxID=56055 RepID=A0A3N2BCH5_9MICO|nr:membrane protein insertase YidC [Bogoriella caseilytica]ROR72935.1 YidC/Oxa1 family membrane protein insertase [Bogoriella caseilytica]
MGWFDTILFPIKWAVAWILVTVHDGLVLLPWLEPGSGPAWVLSIVGLTLVIRTLIIPLFFKQIKAQRGMQLVQPEMQKLQKRYKGKTDPASKQKMQQEMMALYKEHGTNPFASCLPMLLQMPIFFALFRVLYSLEPLAAGTYSGGESIGRLTQSHAEEALTSTLFGAPISSTFLTAEGDETVIVRVVAAFLIVMMSATMFLSQRQLTMKNMPASALDNPFAKQQKLLMYIFPFIFMITGVYFPIGVLIYWTISNLWTMGQQFYTIRRHPSPGSEAYKARQQRINAKRARKGLPSLEEEEKAKSGQKQVEAAPEKTSGQRQQPKRKDRAKKDVTKPGGATPAGLSGEMSAAESGGSASSAESAESPSTGGAESEVEAASPGASNGRPGAGQTSSTKAPQGMTPAERAEWRYRQRMERIRQSKKN